MTLSSLIYVSTSRLEPATAVADVAAIVAHARGCNPGEAITGALLFTGTYFVQVLEGDSAAIDRLMERLRGDPRHDEILVVEQGPILERRFNNWAMAYSGPLQFVERRITGLLNENNPTGQRRVARWFIDLMHEFTKS